MSRGKKKQDVPPRLAQKVLHPFAIFCASKILAGEYVGNVVGAPGRSICSRRGKPGVARNARVRLVIILLGGAKFLAFSMHSSPTPFSERARSGKRVRAQWRRYIGSVLLPVKVSI